MHTYKMQLQNATRLKCRRCRLFAVVKNLQYYIMHTEMSSHTVTFFAAELFNLARMQIVIQLNLPTVTIPTNHHDIVRSQ